MSEINLDARLIAPGALSRTEARLVEMTNGCICCTLRGDLLQEIATRALGEERWRDLPDAFPGWQLVKADA